MRYRLVEIVHTEIVNDEYHMIIECNEYSYEGNKLVNQLSRSPFRFPTTMTDLEIIDSVKNNEYLIYFS